MTYLLDTHTLIWFLENDTVYPKLPELKLRLHLTFLLASSPFGRLLSKLISASLHFPSLSAPLKLIL
jgi:hypothetical protein